MQPEIHTLPLRHPELKLCRQAFRGQVNESLKFAGDRSLKNASSGVGWQTDKSIAMSHDGISRNSIRLGTLQLFSACSQFGKVQYSFRSKAFAGQDLCSISPLAGTNRCFRGWPAVNGI